MYKKNKKNICAICLGAVFVTQILKLLSASHQETEIDRGDVPVKILNAHTQLLQIQRIKICFRFTFYIFLFT